MAPLTVLRVCAMRLGAGRSQASIRYAHRVRILNPNPHSAARSSVYTRNTCDDCAIRVCPWGEDVGKLQEPAHTALYF